ncbi:MAG: hypothetical protein JNG85_02975 [Spirochaetaceae bacterium]|nr:hypothetical protein [Spirochaetaceae bacterium]
MTFDVFAVDATLVSDAERMAFDAFPRLVGAGSAQARAEAAVAFADILGCPGEFRQYALGPQAERLVRIERLLRIFRENVELLVHKTWVEKTDEKRKEKHLEELLAFERDFRDGQVMPAFRRFVSLARSLAQLLFGAQSRADDFLLYCFRIEPKLGLFFWYVGELEVQAREAETAAPPADELLTMETLIGIYVLSSF